MFLSVGDVDKAAKVITWGMRLVIYVRVSTDDQATEGTSPETQLTACRRYCELYSHEIASEERDDISAKNLKRPGIQRAMNLCKTGNAAGIVAWRLDRITRSLHDLLGIVSEMEKANWCLLSVTEQLDTSSPAGRLMISMLGAFAQFERESIGQRVTIGMAQRKMKGEYCGERPVAGLRLVTEGSKKRIERNEQAHLVSPVWGMAVAGKSLTEIAKYLDSNNISASFRKQTKWTTQGARNLINSEMAVKHGLCSEAERLLALQALAKNRGDFARKGKEKHPLAGLVRCPSCDGSMISVTAYGRDKQPYQYFRCCKKIKRGCNQIDQPAHKIQKRIEGGVLRAIYSEDFCILYTAFKRRTAEEQEARDRELRRIELLEEKLLSNIKAVAAEEGRIGGDAWRAAMDALNSDLLAIRARKAAAFTAAVASNDAMDPDDNWDQWRQHAIDEAAEGRRQPLYDWVRRILTRVVWRDSIDKIEVELIPDLAALDKNKYFDSETGKSGSTNEGKLAREALKRTSRAIVISLDKAGVFCVFERAATA